MKKGNIIILCLIVFALCISVASAVPDNNNSKINVTNLKLVDDGYGMYNITGDLIASEKIDSLEMGVIFYDSSDSIVGKSDFAWSMTQVPANKNIKIGGIGFVDGGATPVKAEIYFLKDLDTDYEDAIYATNVTI